MYTYDFDTNTLVELATESDPQQQSDSDLPGLESVASETDANIDSTLYMSSDSGLYTLSDVYNILLSIRNVLLLFLMMWFLFKCHELLKLAFKKHLKS